MLVAIVYPQIKSSQLMRCWVVWIVSLVISMKALLTMMVLVITVLAEQADKMALVWN